MKIIEDGGSGAGMFDRRHTSVVTFLNQVDCNYKSVRARVNDGFEKVGVSFQNL
jgi:hypothetical protein